ncbi:AraC family transcriptional regulator [Nocardia sp. NPDC049149]|uniref:AraC family transcriptional regulator n=1 Tax=Nocardia sp. NPDC049149 TaxID=3364315 RepID=UPI0037103484
MFDRDLRRTTSGVRVLIALADDRGMPALDCLSGTTLSPEDEHCTTHQELRVVRNLVERFGNEPGLGLEAGHRLELPRSGPWGLALLSSRTLRDLIDAMVRYLDRTLVAGRLTVEETSGELRLRFDDTETPPPLRVFLTERTLAGIPAVGRELYGAALSTARTEFRHSAPADLRRHRENFGADLAFDTPANAVVFDSRRLDRPLPPLDERARFTCTRFCRELLERHRPRTGVAGGVRELLIRTPGDIPDQIAVANELFLSPRTLSRRLNEEQTSFRALLDEVRQLLSEQLLAHTDLTTEQVAARLGYAEAASFIRAFRRWKGCPPQEFRLRGGRELAVSGIPAPVGAR